MQSGVIIRCTVNISLEQLLRVELGLSKEQLNLVDTYLLDGMPVDNLENTLVPDAARLALAAGLPGIVGLSMKQGSAVRGLRSGITHRAFAKEENEEYGKTDTQKIEGPGYITLSLYSLTLPQLAGHFLKRGVLTQRDQLLRYARFTPNDACLLNDEPMLIKDLCNNCALLSAPEALFFTANIMSSST
jgi:hypothetical protein